MGNGTRMTRMGRIFTDLQTGYLKATEIEVGLLLNFGEKPEVVRKIFTHDRKQHPIRVNP